MKLTKKLNPKHLFRSKDKTKVSKPTSSFGSGSTSSSVVTTGSITPTSILPNDPYSYIEILNAFKLIDRDNDGTITRHDLKSLLCQLGPTEEEIDVMIQEVDGDGHGRILLEELASKVVSMDNSRGDGNDEMKETFEFFDVDGDGFISAEELLRVFIAIGDERCTLDDCKRMIADVDVDGNGVVCFSEFSRMMDLQR